MGRRWVLYFCVQTWPGNFYGLRDIWGDGPNNMYVIGGQSLLLHNTGSGWTPFNVPNTAPISFSTIWGVGKELFAAGMPGKALLTNLYQYNKNKWTIENIFKKGGVGSFWGTSGKNLYALVGKRTFQYNGLSWAEVNTAGSYMREIWGSSASDIFTVGSDGAVAHYNGSGWSPMVSGVEEDLAAVWGSSGSDVYAVGDNATIIHYDGKSWSGPVALDFGYMGPTSYRCTHLSSVGLSSATAVFAVGTGGTILRRCPQGVCP